MSMVITLNPLLKFSAGQWNTLVNFGLALCGLAGQDCAGTNKHAAEVEEMSQRIAACDPMWITLAGDHTSLNIGGSLEVSLKDF
ncbi:hypothetical protein [Variovorax sp. UC74_104]|uniref:hypothetical protein n=1 Tax=Variovorax sp. UC74_104 TaxID=3374555 RepID=UPI003756B035